MNIGIHQMTAPLRFLFLIQPDNEERFRRAMQTCFMLWGGIYSPIFGYYDELPIGFRQEFGIDITTADYYRNILLNYDPDIILYDEDLDPEKVQLIAGELEAQTVKEYLVRMNNGLTDHAVSTLEVAAHLADREFKFVRGDQMKFVIPEIADENLLLQAFMGNATEAFKDELIECFPDNGNVIKQTLEWDTMDTNRAMPKFELMDVNIYELRSMASKSYKKGSAIYLMDGNRLQHILNFWNLRAAGWQVVPVPIALADNPYFAGLAERFVTWLAEKPNSDHAWITFLIGTGVSEEIVNSTVEKIKPDETKFSKKLLFSYQPWFPRYWGPYEILDADMIKSGIPFHDTVYEHYETEQDRVSFDPPLLPVDLFDDINRRAAYKIIFSLSTFEETAEYAELLTGISSKQLRSLTQPMDFRQWRLSPAGIHRSIRGKDDKIRFSIPKALDFFKLYFANRQHNLVETSNSRLAKEVLKNMHGLAETKFLMQQSRLKIIELFEGGKGITYSELLAEIKRQAGFKTDQCKGFIRRLLENKIIEMGAIIRCGVCEQHGFFLPHNLSEHLTCPICRNQFDLPMADPSSIAWAYRGIGPFARTNKADGVLAVFAALSLFNEEFADTRGKMSALIGFELINHKKNKNDFPKEVDLALILQNQYDSEQEPDLLLCECKTYKRFTDKDIDRMKTLGDAFPGAILTLATLNENLDAEEVTAISDLVRYFQKGNKFGRPQNPVLILTGQELLPIDFNDAFAAYKHQIMPYHRYNDFIGTLCELTIRKHLGIPTWGDLLEKDRIEKINKLRAIGNIMHLLLNRIRD